MAKPENQSIHESSGDQDEAEYEGVINLPARGDTNHLIDRLLGENLQFS